MLKLIFKFQLIVYGVYGVRGQRVAKVVEAVYKSEHGTLIHMKKTGARHVVAFLLNNEPAIRKHALLVTLVH